MGRGNGEMFWEYKLGAPSRWRLQICFVSPPGKFSRELDQASPLAPCSPAHQPWPCCCWLPAPCLPAAPRLSPAACTSQSSCLQSLRSWGWSLRKSRITLWVQPCKSHLLLVLLCALGWGGRQLSPSTSLVVCYVMGWWGWAELGFIACWETTCRGFLPSFSYHEPKRFHNDALPTSLARLPP